MELLPKCLGVRVRVRVREKKGELKNAELGGFSGFYKFFRKKLCGENTLYEFFPYQGITIFDNFYFFR